MQLCFLILTRIWYVVYELNPYIKYHITPTHGSHPSKQLPLEGNDQGDMMMLMLQLSQSREVICLIFDTLFYLDLPTRPTPLMTDVTTRVPSSWQHHAPQSAATTKVPSPPRTASTYATPNRTSGTRALVRFNVLNILTSSKYSQR